MRKLVVFFLDVSGGGGEGGYFIAHFSPAVALLFIYFLFYPRHVLLLHNTPPQRKTQLASQC